MAAVVAVELTQVQTVRESIHLLGVVNRDSADFSAVAREGNRCKRVASHFLLLLLTVEVAVGRVDSP